MFVIKDVPKAELIAMLARRLRLGTCGLDEYNADQAAVFLVETGMVTIKTMFDNDEFTNETYKNNVSTEDETCIKNQS